MYRLYAAAIIVLFLLVATLESRSLKRDIKVPEVRDALKVRFKTRSIIRNKRQNSACDDAHQEASGPKFGDCVKAFFSAVGLQTGVDIETYCANDCPNYFYQVEEELIHNCPDDLGLLPNDTLAAILDSCKHVDGSDTPCLKAWGYMATVYNNQTIVNAYFNCLNNYRGCPDDCQTILPLLSENMGCCYNDVLRIYGKEGTVPLEAFNACNIRISADCSS